MATQQVTAKLCEDPEADAALEASFLAIREGRDPTPFYHVLRTRSPVYFSRRRNMWMLTGHSEVDQVLRSPVAQLQYTKRMDAMRPAWRDHAASAYLEGVIAFVDGPPHQKIRKALMPGWTKPEMERLRPQLRELNERLVDEFVARGGGNFYRDLALPMAEQTIFNLFGIKDVDPAFLRGLVDAFLFVHDYDATPEQLRRADDAALAMREFWEVEYRKRVEQPGDDMLSALARNPGLTVDEGMRIAESVYTGGFDSTALTATTGMWLLLNHPNELKRARQDPDALEKLPDEVLRLAGAIPMTLRVATEDITLGDHVVARGDLIGIGLLAANRDPAVFPDPDRLDLSRPRPRLMSFSSGVHACLGHFLARMELFELYRAVLKRTSRVDIVEAQFRKDRQAAVGMDRLILAVS